MSAPRVLGLCGSLRGASFNAALLRAAIAAADDAGLLNITAYGGLRALPPYDGDYDAPGARPAEVDALRAAVDDADGLLIVTPEYNTGMPGVLKNALDWLGSGPAPGERMPLARKPAAVLGASPGAFGAVRAIADVRGVLHSVDAEVVVKPEVAVFACHTRFDADGTLLDADTYALITDLLGALAGRIDQHTAARARAA